MHGDVKNVYNILVEEYEAKKPFRGARCRLEDNIRIDLRKIVWECVNWMFVAQDRDQWQAFMNTVMNLQVPYNARIFLTS
jgi:hypothetical protein